MIRERVARAVTEVFAPAVLVSVLLVLLAVHTEGGDLRRGLSLGVVAALFESVLPFLYILRGVRTGALTDHHIGDHRQRRGPLLVGLGSVVAGFGVLVWAGAARELLAAVVAGGVGLVVAAGVSHWWKMSIHSAVAAGSVVILMLVYGWWLALAAPLAAAVGWSRVALKDHTVAQVVVGTLVGAVVAGGVFSALR
ncbi:phosphoesterase PA-phosphatase [Dactylosporangium sp. AC04546]|uniref:phosphoesterase PA-phosphatase n=1 Tax=Dactylosporangium sp. AC04546 TaxID=2862460 RepID=UPI002E7AEF32|nr:phosphoesterase PA-phosphatase [Dactylosporangium sp. AC04546]WVK81747.1 phosphoesterase PA-phosphatase [Dactylosporangium sp. AC04546]